MSDPLTIDHDQLRLDLQPMVCHDYDWKFAVGKKTGHVGHLLTHARMSFFLQVEFWERKDTYRTIEIPPSAGNIRARD